MSDINPSSMLPVGTILKDTYRIEGFLSSGGFGNTYVATNFTFNEKVAVKEFFLRGVNLRDGKSTVSVSNPDNRALFDEQLEKFRKEAQRIRKLRSPHVVRVHDLFDANGTAYYVMDYIDGESLAARLRRTQQPLSESEAMRYFGQVLDALEAIHAAGLCHMDLKPDNVMVDKDNNAVLIDFGASKKIASDQLTSTMTGVSYTNGYAPPEQLESDTDNFGPWTDIYALGATLYKLLTNRKPPMPSAIYSDPTPDKSKSLPFPGGVSEQTRQLVRRLMTVVWHERPQSVSDVRRIMGQVEQTEQRTTEYQPQETIYIGDLDLTDGEEVPTVVRNKPQAENNADNSYSYEEYEDGGSNSRKWIYSIIGVLATALIAGGIMTCNHFLKKNEQEREQFQSDSLTKVQQDSILRARNDSIEQARTDSIARAEIAHNYRAVQIKTDEWDNQRIGVISNGKLITTDIGSNYQFVDVLDEHDYDGNGINDCLIRTNPGGQTPSSYMIVYYDEVKKEFEAAFIDIESGDDPWGMYDLKHQIEKIDGQWLITFKLGVKQKVYRFDGTRVLLLDSRKKKTGSVKKEFTHLSVFNSESSEQYETRNVLYDIDGDGINETFIFNSDGSFASSYGAGMGLTIQWNNGNKTQIPVSGIIKYSILSTKTKGLFDILLDDKFLYKWNGNKYVESK